MSPNSKPDAKLDIPDLADIHLAAARIRDHVRLTPVLNDPELNEALSCKLYCKCENLQRTGAFKFRGASNAVAMLRENDIEGDVATHSSGNHGAALALAARLDGRTAHVVMPDNSVALKIESVREYGGQVYFCEANQEAREQGLARLVDAGKVPIPPYDHADIIAGQGTAALELLQLAPELDLLITPAGGGGLVGGTAIIAAAWGAGVIAVEPAGAADIVESLARGEAVDSWQPHTIADGLRALVGKRNFAIIRERVDQVLTVSDDDIRQAMALTWQYLRLTVEPSSATVIAAIHNHPEIFAGRKVGAIISGGNVDPEAWSQIVARRESNG
jgi:threonine dehydratase